MLPSLSSEGWACVPDARMAFRFEAVWDGTPVQAIAVAHSDQITILPDGETPLEVPLKTFGHLFTTLMIAAHSRVD